MLRDGRVRAFAVTFILLANPVVFSATVWAAAPNSSAEIFGDTAPALDEPKAHVHLNELEPSITIEPDGDSVAEPLSDRVKRALDRAATLRDNSRFTEAMIELEKAQRITPGDRRVHRALALTAWQLGGQQRARSHIKIVLDASEDDITCHYILGRLAASRFESETAILEYRKALKCSTDDGTQYFKRLASLELFEALLASGHITAALDLYKVLSEMAELNDTNSAAVPGWAKKLELASSQLWKRAAWAHEQLGEYEQAASLLRDNYGENGPPADEQLAFAKLLARTGEMDVATKYARAALTSQPAAIDVLMAIYKHQNRPDAIVEEFESAIQAGDTSPKVVAAYAGALIEFDRRDEAVRLMKDQLTKPSPTVETMKAAVEVFLAAKAWDAAVEAMADTVRRHPEAATDIVEWIQNHAAAYKESGLTALTSTDPRDAPRPQDFATAFVLGNVALAFDQDEAGRIWLERSLDDRPAFISARVSLAQIYLDRWKWEKAIEIATPDQFQLDRDTRLEVIAGKACLGLDDPQNAIGHFESAVRLHRGNIEAMLALAELYEAQRNPTAARRQLEKIIRIDAFNEKARSQLCLNHLETGDRRAAAEQIQKLRIHRASPTVVAQCVAALEFDARSPDYDRFRKTLQEAIDASKPDAQTLRLIGMSYMQQSDWGEAIKAIEAALALDAGNVEALGMLLECRTRTLEFDKALALQNALLERHPHRRVWKRNLLELLLTDQQFEEAIKYAQQLIAEPDANPNFIFQARFEIISAYRALGKDTEAMKEMEMWRHKESDNPVVLHYVIKAFQDYGNHSRAMELIRRWKTDIHGGYARDDLTDVWQDLLPEQRSEVLELLLDAVNADPQNDQLHTCLIGFLRVTKQYDEALALAKNSAVDGVFKGQYLQELQLIYEATGQVDDAIDVIEGMMADRAEEAARNPDLDAYLKQFLVQVMINGGRAEEAVERLKEWARQARDAGQRGTEFLCLSLLSVAYQEIGEFDSARQALDSYFKRDPTNVGLHNDFGYTLADMGVELDRAEKLIRVAVGESPRNSAYLDSLGWVLYKKGQFAEARRWLTLARNGLEGRDPVIYDHLGDTLWQLGEKEAAVATWTEGLKLVQKRIDHPPSTGADRRTAEAVKAKLDAAKNGGEPKLADVVGAVVETSKSE